MREEQERAEGGGGDAPEQTENAPEPFDQNPPVEPGEPQVGNSRARFFMPREESEDGEEDEEVREDDP
jgi:hypothetical protein